MNECRFHVWVSPGIVFFNQTLRKNFNRDHDRVQKPFADQSDFDFVFSITV